MNFELGTFILGTFIHVGDRAKNARAYKKKLGKIYHICFEQVPFSFLGIILVHKASYIRPCTITAVAITFSTYILQPFYQDCDYLPVLAPQLLAATVISKFYH